MKMNLKATNLELTAAVKDHVNEKLSGLDKYFNNIVQTDVEVGKTKASQSKGEIFFCEINVSVPGKLLRYRRECEDVMKAVNESRKGIQQEIIRYKEKLG